MDYINEHIFEFCGILVAIIVPIIASLISAKKNRKLLSYEILNENLVLASKHKFSELKYFYKEQEVDDLLLFTIKIINNGKIPILKEDFESPIEIIFGDGSLVLEAEVNDKFPPNLEQNITIDEDKAFLKPTLFNSNDNIKLVFLISNVYKTSVTVQARIKGVSELKELSSRISLTTKIYRVFNAVCLAGMLACFASILKPNLIPVSYIILGSIISFTTIASIFYILDTRKS